MLDYPLISEFNTSKECVVLVLDYERWANRKNIFVAILVGSVE
jgi:hypothetical protein